MENKGNREFDQRIREALANYEVAYNPADWTSLEQKLNRSAAKARFIKSAAVVTFIASVAVLSVLLINDEQTIDKGANQAQPNAGVYDEVQSVEKASDKERANATKGADHHAVIMQAEQNVVDNVIVENPSDKSEEAIVSRANSKSSPEQPAESQTPDDAENPGIESEAVQMAEVAVPDLDFSISKHELCTDESVSFKLKFINKACVYNWDFGDGMTTDDTNPTHKYTSAGSYNVKLSVYSNIEKKWYYKTLQNPIVVHATPKADFSYRPDDSHNYLINPEMKFTNHSQDATTWNWNFNGEKETKEESPEYTFRKRGIYLVTLTAMNEFGCTSVKTKEVHVAHDYNLLAPNGFSPNGDGLNDTWMPYALKFSNLRFSLQIIDPTTSRLVFESNEPGNEWDGRIIGNGIAKPGQVFVWVAVVNDQNGNDLKFTGTITIVK